MTERVDRATLVGLGLSAIAAVIYWICNRFFEPGHADFFYLADAFLQGRTWIEVVGGVNDYIEIGGRFYAPL